MRTHWRLLLAAIGALATVAGAPVRGGSEPPPGGGGPAEAAPAGNEAAAGPIELLGEIGPALTAALASQAKELRGRGYLAPSGVLRAGYWGALSFVSRGSFERACEELVRLEKPVSQCELPGAMAVLAEAELAVAQRLGEIDGGSIFPLVTVHGELAGQYLRWGHERLLDHSIGMAARTAALFAASGDEPSARALAAGALATLAARLADAGRIGLMTDVLQAALDVDRDSEAALALMAAHLERSGRPGDAVPYLRRLVAAHPDCREGALRLAVCLRRSGGEVPAGLLESCLEAPAQPWVRAVAYDELARRALDRGDWSGAIAVLSEAVRSQPDLAGPRVLLAYACDRAGRPGDALAALDGVTAAAPQRGPVPRHTYTGPVPETVRRERDRMAEAAGRRLAALADALARTTAPAER